MLSKKISLALDGVTLDRALSMLGKYVNLEFRIDAEAVPTPEDAIIEVADIRGITVHEVLDKILSPMALDYTYLERQEYILISSE